MTNADHLDQAADWFDRFDELDEQGKIDLSLWLTVPEHQQAFTRIASAIGQPEVAAAAIQASKRQRALKTINAQSVIVAPARSDKQRSTRPWYAIAASMAVAATLVIWLGLQHNQQAQPAAPVALAGAQAQSLSVETAAGEPESAVLRDGSVVYLNGNSALQVNHTAALREVSLTRGQAYFDVAHAPDRPFVINVDSTRVQVVGTAFDIDKLAHQTVIRVYEGVVRVFADKSLTLVKGEGVILEDGNWHRTFRIDDSQLPEWRSGWLDVDNQPVSVVAEQLSRYLPKPVKVEGNSGRLIAGRFNLNDAVKSLRLLSAADGMTLDEKDDTYILTVAD